MNENEKETLAATIGKGTAWVSSFSLVTKVIGLGTTFLILSRLQVFEYGILKLVLSIIPLLGFIQLPGINAVIMADMGVEKGKERRGEMNKLFRSFLKLSFLLSFLAWAILFFGAEVVANFYGENVAVYIRIVSFIFLVSPIRNAFQTLFGVYLKFFSRSLYSFTEEFSKFLLIAALIIFFDITIAGILLMTLISQFLPLVFFSRSFWTLFSQFRTSEFDASKPFWHILRGHGKWSIFSSYLNDFGRNIRIWIITLILNTEAVGLYAVASSLIAHTGSLIPLHNVLMPVIPHYVHIKKKLMHLVNKGIKYQLIANVALIGLGMLIIPSIIIFLFPNYAESMPLFRIMLLVLIPNGFAGVFTDLFFALKGQKYLFKAEIIKTAIMLVAAPSLLLLFGLKGIAWEYIITVSLFTLVRYREIKRILSGFSVTLRDYMKYDEYDRVLVHRIRSFFLRSFPFKP